MYLSKSIKIFTCTIASPFLRSRLSSFAPYNLHGMRHFPTVESPASLKNAPQTRDITFLWNLHTNQMHEHLVARTANEELKEGKKVEKICCISHKFRNFRVLFFESRFRIHSLNTSFVAHRRKSGIPKPPFWVPSFPRNPKT